MLRDPVPAGFVVNEPVGETVQKLLINPVRNRGILWLRVVELFFTADIETLKRSQRLRCPVYRWHCGVLAPLPRDDLSVRFYQAALDYLLVDVGPTSFGGLLKSVCHLPHERVG